MMEVNKLTQYLQMQHIQSVGRDSEVGIATHYILGCPGIESRWGARFSVHIQTGSGANPPPIQWVPGLSRGYSGRGVASTTHI
jgi:hypothetical protein